MGPAGGPKIDLPARLLFTALLAVPIAVALTLRRRVRRRITAFEWNVLACCYAGLLLALPVLEDAAQCRRAWSGALLLAAALVLMPVLHVLAASLQVVPLLLLETLVSRWRGRRTPRGP